VLPKARKLYLALALAVAILPAAGEIRVLAVVDAASFSPGLPGPGSLGTIFCTGVTGVSGVIAATGTPLPREIAGVRVTFADSLDAPLLAVADLGGYQQINFQVPWHASGAPTVSQNADSAVVPGNPAPWGRFFSEPDGYVIAQRAVDFSLVTAGNPARPGEWIVAYGTNFGDVFNPPPDGAPTPLDRLFPADLGGPVPWQFVARLRQNGGEVTLTSNFIGLAPGMVGVYQLNIKMPDTLQPGDAQFYVQRSRFCGFFFVQGCGRGLVVDISLPAKLHF
jgi:uncharacterized protein (TIGR03437 family)